MSRRKEKRQQRVASRRTAKTAKRDVKRAEKLKRTQAHLQAISRNKALHDTARGRRKAIRQKAREDKLRKRKGVVDTDLSFQVAKSVDRDTDIEEQNYPTDPEEQHPDSQADTRDEGMNEESLDPTPDPSYDSEVAEADSFWQNDSFNGDHHANLIKHIDQNKDVIKHYANRHGIKHNGNLYDLCSKVQAEQDNLVDDMFYCLVDSFVQSGMNQMHAEALADETASSFVGDMEKINCLDGDYKTIDPALWAAIGRVADKAATKYVDKGIDKKLAVKLASENKTRVAKGLKPLTMEEFKKSGAKPDTTQIEEYRNEFENQFKKSKTQEYMPQIILGSLLLIIIGYSISKNS
jgi:hypothetical protein